MIRRLTWPLCLVLLQVAHPAHADDVLSARVIIDRAIEFAGGRDALARYKKPFVRSVKAVSARVGPAKQEASVTTLFPDKFRFRQTLEGGAVIETEFNGKEGRRKIANPGRAVQMNPMKDSPFPAYEKRLYGEWLSTLLPLDDDAFHLSTVEGAMIEGRPALGVNIVHKDRPDVQLYFDKETFALVKLAYKMGDLLEEYYDDYVELDGLVYPKKEAYFRNGVKIGEWRITELKFLDEVEEQAFQEP